jgi:hypothetical protein
LRSYGNNDILKNKVSQSIPSKEELKSEYLDRRPSSNVEVNATINEWRKSSEGNYIEFVVCISYIGGGKTWNLFKRYSDFVYIHNKILNSYEKDIPLLPPKIVNRSPELLTQRAFQLEEYLNFYLTRYPINPIVLEFCDFENTGSQIFKELSKISIKTIGNTPFDLFK